MIPALRLVSLLALAASLPLSQCGSLVNIRDPNGDSILYTTEQREIKWTFQKHHKFDPATLYLRGVYDPNANYLLEWILEGDVDVSRGSATVTVPAIDAGLYQIRFANSEFSVTSETFFVLNP